MIIELLYSLNATFLALFIISFAVLSFFDYSNVSKKKFRYNQLYVEKENIEEFKRPALPSIKFYGKKDFFGISQAQKNVAIKSFYAQDIPKFEEFKEKETPEKPYIEFTDELEITLNGIVYSSDPTKSMCVFVDEAGKEKVYQVGDQVKDATIVHILEDRVILLRFNGQQETFYTQLSDELSKSFSAEEIIEKDGEEYYLININTFKQHICSLGAFLDLVDLIPAILKESEETIGMLVTQSSDKSMLSSLGLEINDVVTAINGENLNNYKQRVKIYDMITNLKNQDEIEADIFRGIEKITLKYKIIDKPVKKKKNIKSMIQALNSQSQNKTNAESKGENIIAKKSKDSNEKKEIQEIHKKNISDIRKDLTEKMMKRERSK